MVFPSSLKSPSPIDTLFVSKIAFVDAFFICTFPDVILAVFNVNIVAELFNSLASFATKLNLYSLVFGSNPFFPPPVYDHSGGVISGVKIYFCYEHPLSSVSINEFSFIVTTISFSVV